MRIWLSVFALLLLLGVRPAASADASSHRWATVGNWEVWVDHTQGDGCFIVRVYERNAAFRVGFTNDTSRGYVFLANDAWKSLVAGSKYPIEIQFDSKPSWNGNATAEKVGAVTFLNMDFTGQKLINDMAHSDSASIKYGGQLIASVRLAGVGPAVDELLRCQSSPDRSLTLRASGSKSRSTEHQDLPTKDPFAR